MAATVRTPTHYVLTILPQGRARCVYLALGPAKARRAQAGAGPWRSGGLMYFAASALATATQGVEGRREPGEDNRLDPSRAAAPARREDALGRRVREDRRCGPAHRPRRCAAGARCRHGG